MTEHALRTVTRTQGNNRALKDGTITPSGFSLDFEEVPVLVHAFRRMVRGLDFDVSEMAATTYLCAREHGVAFTALPVFLVRGFHHGAILVSTRSGVREPRDLEGRRVGVNRGYTVTTGVWARGILSREYGVRLDDVTWVLSGEEHVATYRPPANVVPAGPGADLGAMLVDGELDAVIGAPVDHPDVVPLLPDPDEAGFEALTRRGLYPVNHLVVVREETLRAHPDAAAAVFDAFAQAKQLYVEQLCRGDLTDPSATDRMYARVMETLGDDPLPYGIEPNRAILEELLQHATDQHIVTRPVSVDSLFAESVRDRVA